MVSNFRRQREPLRNMLMLLPLLLLAGFVSACGTAITSGPSPTPTTSLGFRGTFHEYALPPSQFVPGSIAAGPDGNLWFTEIMQNGSGQAGRIERMTPTGTLSQFSLPSANMVATGIITGPDGNLWFAEGGKIARITPMGKISEFPLPSANVFPSSITTGPDGNLWFTEQNKIGRMTLIGKVSEFSLPFHQYSAGSNPTKAPAGSAQGEPLAITAWPDGNLWFTETGARGGPSKIGVITPQGKIREFTLSHFVLGSITRGAEDALWFTEFQYGGTGKIGRITTAGKISEFPLPTSGNGPVSITLGTDHTLWFTEVEGADASGKNGKIGHLV